MVTKRIVVAKFSVGVITLGDGENTLMGDHNCQYVLLPGELNHHPGREIPVLSEDNAFTAKFSQNLLNLTLKLIGLMQGKLMHSGPALCSIRVTKQWYPCDQLLIRIQQINQLIAGTLYPWKVAVALAVELCGATCIDNGSRGQFRCQLYS